MALVFRVIAHIAIAVLALALPGVGPNRFWVAGLLVGVGSPIAILINLRINERSRNWAEALLDLVMVITLVHLVPHLWVVLMCLGLMIALAPSVGLHPASHWIYLVFGVLLLGGMTFAVVLHDADGWELPLIAVAVTYPSMLYYTHSQMQRSNELRQRAYFLNGMTQLAGSVAHDFNNVLTTVTGHAELAQLKLLDSHPAKQNIARVLSGAEQATLLCRQLLSISGRNVQSTDRVDLAAEVHAMASLLGPAIPSGVTLEIDTRENIFIIAEVVKVHQVLMEVILHASEGMVGRTGQISIRLRRTVEEERHIARLTVHNDSPRVFRIAGARLFERFLNSQDDRQGFGLATTKKVMAQLGGAITSRSDTFGSEISLSWQEAPEGSINDLKPVPSTVKWHKNHSDQQILVVDDDDNVRSATVSMLQHLGYNTLAAGDAFEAVQIFRDKVERINAVLLDLKMPVKNGWECLNDLRTVSKETPVVLCSGFDPNNNVRTSMRNDEYLSFLQKPYRVDELVVALNAVARFDQV